MNSFFEGPEKKAELEVVEGHAPLRGLGEDFWERVVDAAGAQILSRRENPRFTAYLLSESSLFVFDDFITMITCGRTTLVDAVEMVVGAVGTDAVAMLVYERKREHFPHDQHTSFYEDASRLNALVPGRALRFGVEHEHAVRLFHSVRPHAPDQSDRTLEVLMHGIDDRRAAVFRVPGTERSLLDDLAMPRALEGFDIDERCFEPVGYSLNGLRDGAYVTLHVTPERVGSYVSFETNADFGHDPSALVAEVVARFRPEAFDVIAFEPDGDPVFVEVPDYVLRQHVQEPVSGYHVTFQHFYRPTGDAPVRAFELPLG